ncbi:MAG: hypothetical protein H6730_10950 [Deltaproteobacteria bacterium]|nr:hypothetical protein [Deltaproteobacteria bacterium]
MLQLATSCLQGRPMQAAAEALLALRPDGLQLTPGNAPTPGFEAWLVGAGVPHSAHHGFCFEALRAPVWRPDGRCRWRGRSVHPPRLDDAAAPHLEARVEMGDLAEVCLETMYPGYRLGTGVELEWAMQAGLRLAVDVSHVFLQLEAGVMGPSTWRRLQDYPRLDEVHVSANDGRRDRHRPLASETFGLGWARARLAAGGTVVIESYLHRLDADTRAAQVDLLREGT